MRKVKSLLIASVALAGMAGPAAAQWYGASPYNAPPPPYGYGGPDYARPLPRDVIVERLEDRGFDDVGRPRFDGSVYVVEATSRRGGAVRLVVDAFDGRILRQTALSVARLESPDDDGLDIDAYAGRPRRGAYPPPEMPSARGFREPEPLPGRQAARPAEPEPIAPPITRDRGRPADPRLSPEAPAATARPLAVPEEPRREASRPSAPNVVSPPSGSGVEGINPDSKRATARPTAKPTPERQAPAAARTSPSAPAPSTAAKPEAPKPVSGPTTAEAGERKVRVIEGVTPMNGGGQQSSPAPQNNVDVKSTTPARN